MKDEMRELDYILTEIDSVYSTAALKLGVTDTEMNILYVIHGEGNGCNQSCLYKKTGITRSTINSALHKMQERGEIKLVSGEGRNVRVELTRKGKKLSDRTVGVFTAAEADIFDSWSERDRKKYLELNKKYLDDLKERVAKL